MKDEYIRHEFLPGEERKALTSVSDECSQGHCQNCRGIFERDDYPGQSVFCVHSCHLKSNQGKLKETHCLL